MQSETGFSGQLALNQFASMPSLLKRAALLALSGSGGRPSRRLATDNSLTPCTHNICGVRTLNLPDYTASSRTPGGDTDLDLDDTAYGSLASVTMSKDGDDIKITATFQSSYSGENDKCHLAVNVTHAPQSSDQTLREAPNQYNANANDYSGATTLAAPATSPACGDACALDTDYSVTSLTVVVNPSSYPYRYPDTTGAKLHTGRLGVKLTPYLYCTGFNAGSLADKAIYLKVKNSGANAPVDHPIHYDLVANATKLTPQDQAGTISGTLKAPAAGVTAKRIYDYSAAFSHFHDQVRFPDTSIVGGKTHADHFSGLVDPADAHCYWWSKNESGDEFVAELTPSLRTSLTGNGWFGGIDVLEPQQPYTAWSAGVCAAGICAKYEKTATVHTSGAYLGFDKPLVDYYKADKQPKVDCVSQTTAGSVSGTSVSSSVYPDLASDTAPDIATDVVVGFKNVVNIPGGCAAGLNGANSDICLKTGTTGKFKGEIFTYDRVDDFDFVNLLTDEYNFRASFTCDQATIAGNNDPCPSVNGTDQAAAKLSSLKRDDSGVSLAAQLIAKALAVENLEFQLPLFYGTTFSNYQATLGTSTVTGNAQKFRNDGTFAVTMLAYSSETTPGLESLQWTGGVQDTLKDFDGFTTTDRFVERTPAITAQVRAKSSALTGYYVTNAAFSAKLYANGSKVLDADGNEIGVMSPFNVIADLAGDSDDLKGKNDVLTSDMWSGNQYWAVKSHCCGKVGAVTVGGSSVDCDAANKAPTANAETASVYCRTNGFDAVRCLDSTLAVEYTVETQSLDDRFASSTKTATKTYSNPAVPSKSQEDQGFVVDTGSYNAVTVGAGEQAGTSDHSYPITTAHMGGADASFARVTTGEDRTYNCDAAGRDILYETFLDPPCGESYLAITHQNYMAQYKLNATAKAHYVYMSGAASTKDQVSQKTRTAAVASYDKNNGAQVKDPATNTGWLTTEWRVQESSAPSSPAKGSDSPIELKVVISNDNSVTGYDSALHLPDSDVFIIDDATLKVKTGPGDVSLKECKTESGETFCILEYSNQNLFGVSKGSLCGQIGEPACPVIEYTIGAKVLNGDVANAFGAGGACAATASSGIATTQVGAVRSHTLYVEGNSRAYDGVLDIHVAERDSLCKDYCNRPDVNAGTGCANNPPTVNFSSPTVVGDDYYCLNPVALATEQLHNVSVPGKDGAATTFLDQGTAQQPGQIQTSKDLTFEVRYFQIGTGPRTFTIEGLDIPQSLKDVGLPKPQVCSDANFKSSTGCVGSAEAGTTQPVADDQFLTDGSKRIGIFYLSLGASKTFDVCANTNVAEDPYTLNGVRTLGFRIKVEYNTFGGATGSGDPDSGEFHDFYFQLRCPQKAYSLNLAQPGSIDQIRKNIPAGADIGLVDKNVFAKSHYNVMRLLTFFSGRSSAKYHNNVFQNECLTDINRAGCHKASVRMEANQFVEFEGGATEVYIDEADEFSKAQVIAFEFKKACLFTSITLISKSAPFSDTGTVIGDTEFKFRVQCPRWREDAKGDDLVLDYNVAETNFTATGGGVAVLQPILNATGMVNDFTNIQSALVGSLCDAANLGSISSQCIFPDAAAGAKSILSKTGSQQTWLNFLSGCGFTQTSGSYTGFMQRTYTRPKLIASQGLQSYCSGRKLSFGIKTFGTHTATFKVESPKEMDFAVQVDKLQWEVCNATNANSYRMVAEATLYRREYTSDNGNAFQKADDSTLSDIELNTAFFDDASGNRDVLNVTGSKINIQGNCEVLASDESNCNAFEIERTVGFGATYRQYGVDYSGALGFNLAMTCPRGTKEGSDTGQLALRHDIGCANYGEDSFSGANCAGTTTYQNVQIYKVSADGQVQLELIIDDTSFLDHVVSEPTYSVVAGTLAGVASQNGKVSELCDASQLDCMFQATGPSGAIQLVGDRAYPDNVTIGGTSYDFSNRADEENSLVTLRALPLSGTTMQISWRVDRVLANNNGTRRLRAVYTLGASANDGVDVIGFEVIPVVREEGAGVATQSAAQNEVKTVVEVGVDGSHDHAEDADGGHTHVGMWVAIGTTVLVLVGGFAIYVSVRNGGGEEKREKPSRIAYAKIPELPNPLWRRNRFNNKQSRFL